MTKLHGRLLLELTALTSLMTAARHARLRRDNRMTYDCHIFTPVIQLWICVAKAIGMQMIERE